MLLARGATWTPLFAQQIPYRTKLDRGGDGVLGNGTTPLLRAAKAADIDGHQAADRQGREREGHDGATASMP